MLVRCLLAVLCATSPGFAQSCDLDFTIEVTQGVGMIRPGTELNGSASFETGSESFRQEDGSTAHLAEGEMRLEPDIRGGIWTLVTTARDFTADLVGVYAQDVTGLSFAGIQFEGPMVLTLYGRPGTRPEPIPPVNQAEWDALDLRRTFQVHSDNGDMLSGDVVRLIADCE